MGGVLAARIAELLELQTASCGLLVLGRRVVPVLAIRALECNDFAHLFILTDLRYIPPKTNVSRSQPTKPPQQWNLPDDLFTSWPSPVKAVTCKPQMRLSQQRAGNELLRSLSL